MGTLGGYTRAEVEMMVERQEENRRTGYYLQVPVMRRRSKPRPKNVRPLRRPIAPQNGYRTGHDPLAGLTEDEAAQLLAQVKDAIWNAEMKAWKDRNGYR